MRRKEFIALAKRDHKAAVICVADAIFDTHDLDSLRDLFRELHVGWQSFQPLRDSRWDGLVRIMDETVTWDEEEDTCPKWEEGVHCSCDHCTTRSVREAQRGADHATNQNRDRHHSHEDGGRRG